MNERNGGIGTRWLVRRAISYLGGTPPLVSWTQPGVLFLAAAILGLLAWHTRRALDASEPCRSVTFPPPAGNTRARTPGPDGSGQHRAYRGARHRGSKEKRCDSP